MSILLWNVAVLFLFPFALMWFGGAYEKYPELASPLFLSG